MSGEDGEVTALLAAWHRGEEGAESDLIEVVYGELRQLATSHLQTEYSNHVLEPAALVHEAYMRLVRQTRTGWRNRQHFFGIASRMMRRVLTDYARRQRRAKRGGDWVRVSFDSTEPETGGTSIEVSLLDEALAELRELDERKATMIELRFFAGLTVEETADHLGCSRATIHRDWLAAKAWLVDRLDSGDSQSARLR